MFRIHKAMVDVVFHMTFPVASSDIGMEACRFGTRSEVPRSCVTYDNVEVFEVFVMGDG